MTNDLIVTGKAIALYSLGAIFLQISNMPPKEDLEYLNLCLNTVCSILSISFIITGFIFLVMNNKDKKEKKEFIKDKFTDLNL